jgi:hypothetical protein
LCFAADINSTLDHLAANKVVQFIESCQSCVLVSYANTNTNIKTIYPSVGEVDFALRTSLYLVFIAAFELGFYISRGKSVNAINIEEVIILIS